MNWIEESDWYCLIQNKKRLSFVNLFNIHYGFQIQKDSRKTAVDWTTKFTSWFFVIIKFIYSEKFPKIWKNLQLLLTLLSTYVITKKCDIFFNFLWPSQNIWTLLFQGVLVSLQCNYCLKKKKCNLIFCKLCLKEGFCFRTTRV